jgi:hypothetical protein
MWEPQSLTTLWASTAYYKDSFTFNVLLLLLLLKVKGKAIHITGRGGP